MEREDRHRKNRSEGAAKMAPQGTNSDIERSRMAIGQREALKTGATTAPISHERTPVQPQNTPDTRSDGSNTANSQIRLRSRTQYGSSASDTGTQSESRHNTDRRASFVGGGTQTARWSPDDGNLKGGSAAFRKHHSTRAAQGGTVQNTSNAKTSETQLPIEAATPAAHDIGAISHERAAGQSSRRNSSSQTASQAGTFISTAANAITSKNLSGTFLQQASDTAYRKMDAEINQDDNEGLTAAQKGVEAYRQIKNRGTKQSSNQQRESTDDTRTRNTRQESARRKRDVHMGSTAKDKPSKEAAQKEYSQFLSKKRLQQSMMQQSGNASAQAASTSTKTAASASAKGAATGGSSVLAIAGVVVLALIVLILLGAFLFTTVTGFMAGTTYLASDEDLNEAELWYSNQEADLLVSIYDTPMLMPFYDEYQYNIGAVGHDPHELLAYLTAKYLDFNVQDVIGDMSNVFTRQYSVQYEEFTQTYEYEGEIYTWTTLVVTLISNDLSSIIELDDEQANQYQIYRATKGLRQYVLSPLLTEWGSSVVTPYGWSFDNVAQQKVFNNGVDIRIGGTEPIIAAKDGVISSVAYSDGWTITIDHGDGLVTRYANCGNPSVSVGQAVETGDELSSSNDMLHFEVIKNGNALNPSIFAWQTTTETG